LPDPRIRSSRFSFSARIVGRLNSRSGDLSRARSVSPTNPIEMKKTLLQLLWFVLFASSVSANDDFPKRQARIAADLESLPVTEGQFVLYALDPTAGIGYDVNTDKIFHGFRILGKADVTATKDKNALLSSLASGVRGSDGMVAACFNPRHGIQLVKGKVFYDFVICFECRSVKVYGFNKGQGFLTTETPTKVFNGFLEKYHLTAMR
jgi:hypothetical protein